LRRERRSCENPKEQQSRATIACREESMSTHCSRHLGSSKASRVARRHFWSERWGASRKSAAQRTANGLALRGQAAVDPMTRRAALPRSVRGIQAPSGPGASRITHQSISPVHARGHSRCCGRFATLPPRGQPRLLLRQGMRQSGMGSPSSALTTASPRKQARRSSRWRVSEWTTSGSLASTSIGCPFAEKTGRVPDGHRAVAPGYAAVNSALQRLPRRATSGSTEDTRPRRHRDLRANHEPRGCKHL
jgi:hypothetical protein